MILRSGMKSERAEGGMKKISSRLGGEKIECDGVLAKSH
jgi:hypothetical protein